MSEDATEQANVLALMEASLQAETLGGSDEPKVELPAKEAPKEEVKTPDKTETGKEAPKDGSLKETEKKPEEKPKSKYAQETERRNITWDKINQEKVALQQEKERLAREKEELQRATVKSQPFRDEHGHTAEAYEEFAKHAEKTGDKANAEAALKAAAAVRQAEGQAKQQAAAADLQSKWAQNYQKLSTEHPDLKNKDSEMYKETMEVLNKHPLLTQDANGISVAVEAVLVRRMYRDSQAVSAENKSLKEQIETLQKKLSLSSGVAAEPPKGDTPFDKLSESEQRSKLETMLTNSPDWGD